MDLLLIIVIVCAPLLAGGLIAVSSQALGERTAAIGISASAVSLGASLLCLVGVVNADATAHTLPWLPHPLRPVILVDRLAAVMLTLITGVSLVIQTFSKRYMQDEAGYGRFFALVNVLTAVLLALVTSGNLFWLAVCWHAVTWLLRSLLAFDRRREPAQRAGRTVLLTQSLGDGALVAGILLLYAGFGTLDVRELFERVSSAPDTSVGLPGGWTINAVSAMTTVTVLAIMTKSAQFPFHVWLPGTIEAPTPVSAMLHAGIVNAGGFLVNRLAPLYGASSETLYLLFIIGAVTALIGASTMLTQPSIKRTLVYSTMGQMGYMVMECGLGAFALAIFHLCAHGLFKAALFLNSAGNIHKARTEFKLPHQQAAREPSGFSLVSWLTGLAITLILPLLILLVAHGLVNIPLFAAQGTTIFLFFAWVTSSQAIFSLYRMHPEGSWKVSVSMVAALAAIGLTYLWAAESFTHFLYPQPGQAAAFFEAAAWNEGLFESFVVLAALAIVGVWIVLYAKAHGYRLLLPTWLDQLHARLYVWFLNEVYVEASLRAVGRRRSVPRRRGTDVSFEARS
jgi:NADH-quinone oxidoreductase subunit L